jgi:phosphoglycerate kinase
VKTLDDLIASLDEDVTGRRVLVRADLNVPLDGARITDDGRIRASVPTIARLRETGVPVIVTAHLGRPKGGPDPKYSLGPVAERLGELLGVQVPLADLGDEARATVDALGAGGVALLENIRFDPRETSKNDDERAALARETASAWCTASRRRSTTWPATCLRTRAGWCSPRSRCCAGSPRRRSGPTRWCWAVRRSPTSSR